jgi:uncharacterized protein YjbI with pentapeptide repeats
MEAENRTFMRKRYFLIGSFLTLVAAAIGGNKIDEKIMTRDISELPEIMAMLTDIDQRRILLKDKKLIVENVNFDQNFREYINCENTVFLNCFFGAETLLRIIQLSNVEFVNCFIEHAEISGGLWNNVKFSKSTAKGEFVILAGEGNNNVTFANCDFAGAEPSDSTTHENHFGKVGGAGSVSFDSCKLKYVNISCGGELAITNSELRKIGAARLQEGGSIRMKNIKVNEYIEFDDGVFSSFEVEDSEFELMNLHSVKSSRLQLMGCIGQFVGEFMSLEEMLVVNSTFISHGEKRNPFENRYAALCTNASVINKLVLDNVKFSGVNGTMFLGGSSNILYNKQDPESGNAFFSSKFVEILIKDTPLKNAFFGNLEAGKLSIKVSTIENASFGNSNIRLLELSDVRLLGSIDFRGTKIDCVVRERSTHERGLAILQDPGKDIQI